MDGLRGSEAPSRLIVFAAAVLPVERLGGNGADSERAGVSKNGSLGALARFG